MQISNFKFLNNYSKDADDNKIKKLIINKELDDDGECGLFSDTDNYVLDGKKYKWDKCNDVEVIYHAVGNLPIGTIVEVVTPVICGGATLENIDYIIITAPYDCDEEDNIN